MNGKDLYIVDYRQGTTTLLDSTTAATITATFTPGDQLSCRSIGDWDCIFRFTVLKRTAKFVTLAYYGDTIRVGVKVDRDGNEYCHPFGSYSMCATLRAGVQVER